MGGCSGINFFHQSIEMMFDFQRQVCGWLERFPEPKAAADAARWASTPPSPFLGPPTPPSLILPVRASAMVLPLLTEPHLAPISTRSLSKPLHHPTPLKPSRTGCVGPLSRLIPFAPHMSWIFKHQSLTWNYESLCHPSPPSLIGVGMSTTSPVSLDFVSRCEDHLL